MTEEDLYQEIQKEDFQYRVRKMLTLFELRIRYHRDKKHRPIGCVVTPSKKARNRHLMATSGEFGWAMCHKDDLKQNFTKKKGLLIAVFRLLNSENTEEMPRELKKLKEKLQQTSE